MYLKKLCLKTPKPEEGNRYTGIYRLSTHSLYRNRYTGIGITQDPK